MIKVDFVEGIGLSKIDKNFSKKDKSALMKIETIPDHKVSEESKNYLDMSFDILSLSKDEKKGMSNLYIVNPVI